MKKLIRNVSCLSLLLIPSVLFAQRAEKTLIAPEQLTRTYQTTVVQTNNQRTEKVANLSTLQLASNEKKLVVKTDPKLLVKDRSVVPRFESIQNIEKVQMLPELYYAKVAGTNAQIRYRILMIDATPLRYDFKQNLFKGVLQFIPVEVASGPNPVQKQLADPEEIIVKYGASSTPLKLTQVNWPPIDFNVVTPNVLDSFEVKVLTITNPSGYPSTMPVEPAIELSTPRRKMQGLGVQTIPVYVSLKGVSSYNPPITVSVASSMGNVDNAEVTLSDATPREVTIRSENVGRFNLQVVNSNLQSNTIRIESVFPWLFFGLAILGGLIGSLAKLLVKKEKIKFKWLLLGAVIGLILASAYWGLGINLLAFEVKIKGLNEIMVLAFGLLGGYFGIRKP